MKSKNPQEDCNLRPWTVNPNSEKILVQEVARLDKILTRTTPQKNAGYRGSSSLEKLPELADFQNTMKETLEKSPIFNSPKNDRSSSYTATIAAVSDENVEMIDRATRIQNAIRIRAGKMKDKLQPLDMKAIPYEQRNSPAVMKLSTKDFRQLLQVPSTVRVTTQRMIRA
eukprot:gene23377-31717_t